MTFTRVCALDDVEEPGALHVELDDVPIAVVRSDGEVYATWRCPRVTWTV
jgi:3-phenylpropionate/trans-cinnamate dioxygenase ferredoxin subunit